MAALNSTYPSYDGHAMEHGVNHTPYQFQSRPNLNQTLRTKSNGVLEASYSLSHGLPPLGSLQTTTNTTVHGSLLHGNQNMPMQSPVTTSQPPSYLPALAAIGPYAPTAQLQYNSFAHTNSNGSASQTHIQQQLSRPRPGPIETNLQQKSLPPFNPPSAYSSQPAPAYTLAPSMPRNIAPMPMPIRPDASMLDGSNGYIQQELQPAPTHVVGQQGRRGPLPSDPGRPSAFISENQPTQKGKSGHKGGPVPVKDADGKFPCDYCHRKYRHQKHLKRHQLRHMNIRPYTCGLCLDAFSRSDILKRHFTKCEFRRGNPEPEKNHLAHSRAHKARQNGTQEEVKQDEDEEAASLQNDTPTASLHGEQSTQRPLADSSYVGANGGGVEFDFNDLSIQTPNHDQTLSPVDRSSQVSQLNNVKNSASSNGTQSNRTSFGPIYGSSYDLTSYATSTGYVTPDSVTTSGVATPYTFPHETRSTPLSPDDASNAQLLAAISRAPTAPSYSYASLPHIVDDAHGRGNESHWSSYPFNHTQSYSHSAHQSGTNTPLTREQKPIDFSVLPAENFYHRRH